MLEGFVPPVINESKRLRGRTLTVTRLVHRNDMESFVSKTSSKEEVVTRSYRRADNWTSRWMNMGPSRFLSRAQSAYNRDIS